MSYIATASRVGLILAIALAHPLGPHATLFAQQTSLGTNDKEAATQTGFTTDFEVKNAGNGFSVRRKGTQEWLQPGKLSERIAVGQLDSGHTIYLVTKAIKPPRAKRTPDPEYPESESLLRQQGRVLLHLIVDDKGMVRLPTVDASPDPVLAKSAISAVTKWVFDPAKLDTQPVAVLIRVEVQFRLY